MTGHTRIKICGIRDEQMAAAAVNAGADAIGLVFAKDSPRRVDPAAAADIVCSLPPLVEAVGVFVDLPPDRVARLADDACLRTIQVHGNESENTIRELMSDYAIIRGIRFSADEVRRWGDNSDIDMLLVDGSAGGEGTALDWSALAAMTPEIKVPLILAGGLNPTNVAHAIRAVCPFAVDVSTGVERSRGAKDPALINAFCDAVRLA